jgi:hypothetical protein
VIPGAILAQMKDRIVVQLGTTLDAYGMTTPASAITVFGRVTYDRDQRATTGGEEVGEQTVILMPDIEGFTVDAQVTLPDGTTRPVRSFRRPSWPSGAKHLRVVV